MQTWPWASIMKLAVSLYEAKKKNMCVSCYISKKIRVGRSLLIFFFFFNFYFLFSLI